MKKITQKMVLNVVLNYVQSNKTYEVDADTAVSGADILEKAKAMLVQLDKKNSVERKPSEKDIAKQNADAELRTAIVAEMEQNRLYSAVEICALPTPCASQITPAKVHYLMRDSITNGVVVKSVEKRHTFYSLAG